MYNIENNEIEVNAEIEMDLDLVLNLTDNGFDKSHNKQHGFYTFTKTFDDGNKAVLYIMSALRYTMVLEDEDGQFLDTLVKSNRAEVISKYIFKQWGSLC